MLLAKLHACCCIDDAIKVLEHKELIVDESHIQPIPLDTVDSAVYRITAKGFQVYDQLQKST